MWHADRGRLLLRTPVPVPLGIAYVLLVETNSFSEFIVISPDYALRISLGTFSILFCCKLRGITAAIPTLRQDYSDIYPWSQCKPCCTPFWNGPKQFCPVGSGIGWCVEVVLKPLYPKEVFHPRLLLVRIRRSRGPTFTTIRSQRLIRQPFYDYKGPYISPRGINACKDRNTIPWVANTPRNIPLTHIC